MRQGKEFGRLVKGFAGRVVDGAAEAFEPVGGVDDQELAMPARDEKEQVGKGRAVGQARCERMAGKVVDPQKGQAGGQGDGLGRHHARQDAADEARAGGGGDGVKVAKRDARLRQRLFDDDVDAFGMRPGGDVGDDAAKGRVQVSLPPDNRGKDRARAIARAHDGGGGVVAA